MTGQDPFADRPLTESESAEVDLIRELCRDVYTDLMELPESPERALAITKLEECHLWANKAIAFHGLSRMVLTDNIVTNQ